METKFLRQMSNDSLLLFTKTLSTRNYLKFTDNDLFKIELFIESDGCTGVPDFYRDCCIIHDFWYRTHRDFNGRLITEEEADYRFKKCIFSRSIFGQWSPMAWWRYYGLKLFGKKAWENE